MMKLSTIAKLTIYTISTIYTTLTFANFGMGFGVPFEMSTEDKREFYSDPKNYQFIAIQIASVFKENQQSLGGFNMGGSVGAQDSGQPITKGEHIEKILSSYGLNDPDLADIQDSVLSESALRLAQNEVDIVSDKENPYMLKYENSRSTKALENFVTTINSSGKYSTPSQLDKAYKLKKISEKTTGNYKAYLKELEENFEGKELSRIAQDSMMSFEFTPNTQVDFLKTMLKGEIDQSYLNGVIHFQLMNMYSAAESMYPPTPGLLELATEYYDFNSKSSMFGTDYLLCDLSKQVYNKTEYRKVQEGEPKPGFPGIMPGNFEDSCIECVMQNDIKIDKEKRDKMTKMMDQNQVNKVAKLISLGADASVICEGGLSPIDHLEIAEAEGFVSLEDFNSMLSVTSADKPCHVDIIDQNIPELCDTANVLNWVNNEVKRQGSMIKRSKRENSTVNFVSAYSDDNCNFSILNKQVKQGSRISTESIELRITPINGDGEISISDKDKEEFLAKLEKLIVN